MTNAKTRSILAERLHAVEQRIRAACQRVNRARDEVTLVAVTKYVSSEIAAILPELGVFDLGESRPQELWRKAAALPKDVRWHLIGHLQRNKIEKTLPLVHLIHSVDSMRLLEALHVEANNQSRKVDVLLEVNLSREPNKHGFDPSDFLAMNVASVPFVDKIYVGGLMTMAADTDEPELARPTFRELRWLRDTLEPAWSCLGSNLKCLSMGMTHDFEIAIEEGATLVRIGSALFEGLTEPQS